MKAIKKIFIAAVALIVLLIAGISIALLTVDPNKYRTQIVDVLSKQTGRSIKLGGPIKFGFSLHGLTLSIQDAAVGNPAWASRPDMAGIGHFELGIALLPLLDHQLSITQLKIANADILLETDPNGKNNWDMAVADKGKANAKVEEASTGKSTAINIDKVAVTDSQVAVRGKDGKTNIYKAKSMTLGIEGGGLALHFDGQYDGAPITLALKTGAKDFSASGTWPLDADLTYANYRIKAKGTANPNAKKADISSYTVSAGSSSFQGHLAANWSGARPAVNGTLTSEKLNPADFKPPENNGTSDKAAPPPASSNNNRVFSDAPLGLDALKSADAVLEVNIAEMTAGAATLRDISSKLTLQNGHMTLPLKATLDGDKIGGEITLDAAGATPQAHIAFSAPSVDLAHLLKLANAPGFLEGKANFDMDMTSSGNSMHALASNANGKLDVIGEGGKVDTSAANSISSLLGEVFNPKGGVNALNCLATRFNATNGVIKDNGILVDSSATTVAGKGGFNLGAETIDMTLRARTKLVNVGNILPALHVGGTFKNPGFGVDPTAIAQNVIGILTTGSMDGGVATVSGPAGQNACIYTLDHPAPAQPNAVQNTANKAGSQIKSIGNNLVKGLFGK